MRLKISSVRDHSKWPKRILLLSEPHPYDADRCLQTLQRYALTSLLIFCASILSLDVIVKLGFYASD